MGKITAGGVVVVVLAAVAVGAGTYLYQQQQVSSAKRTQRTLTSQVHDLQAKYDKVVAAAKISTQGWKKYCDPQAPFCFTYPTDWTLKSGVAPGTPYVTAQVTNPAGTVAVQYYEPLVRDDGPSSEHIVSTLPLKVGGEDVAIIGAYYVASGAYSPHYAYYPATAANDAEPGGTALLGEPSRVNIGKYDAISLTGGPLKKITSRAQADAWFISVDGKTTLEILKTFTTK